MSCSKHPKFSGLRLGKVARECEECVKFYHELKTRGVKETRNRGGERKTVVEQVKVDAKTLAVTPEVSESEDLEEEVEETEVEEKEEVEEEESPEEAEDVEEVGEDLLEGDEDSEEGVELNLDDDDLDNIL